jgi:hypothetical protein
MEAKISKHVHILWSFPREEEGEFPCPPQRFLKEVDPTHVFDALASGIRQALESIGQLVTEL